MKASSFLNCDEVVIKSADGKWWKLNEKYSRIWIADFLYWVAGQGEGARHIKDGKIEDGNFVNAVKTYYDVVPHKPVHT